MNSIFFDLETTDLNPVGQILNYAFVEIDNDWNMRSCLRGKIKISRLQLPSPGAICATGVDVFDHNATADSTEAAAMAKIQKYLADIIEWQDTRLVGYNSNKFDIPYLRTSMIRNGLNPYFGGSVKYGDLLHVVRRLACDNPEFSKKLLKNDKGKPSFKLESVAKSFGLLTEEQQHESLSDVMLTIKVARYIQENYNIDVREYSSYEVSKKNFDVIKVFPYTDKDGNQVSDDYCYMALLEQNKTQALWINLKKFEDGLGKDAVSWYNKNTSALYVKEYVSNSAMSKRASAAKAALSDVTLATFFGPKNCDVEQFIFMMPISEIGALYEAIWMKDLTNLKSMKSKYGSQLYIRHLANEHPIENVEQQIKDYALYRYGGKMKIDKENFDSKFEDGVYNESFHPTYNELLSTIDELLKNEKHAFVMNQLKRYYETSTVSSLAGDDLRSIKREKVS